jgi:hypothetical protein
MAILRNIQEKKMSKSKTLKRLRWRFKKMSRTFKELYWSIKSMGDPDTPHKLHLRELISIYTPDWIWDIIYAIENFFLWIRKSFSYAWMLRSDRDWHSGDTIRLLHFKLTRVRKALIGNDYHRTEEHDNEMAQIIDRMLFLLDRINNHKYRPELDDNFDKVFGKLVSWSQKEIGPDGKEHIYFKMKHANINTPEEKELASKEMLAIREAQDKARQDDLDEFGKLFASKIDLLWD